MITKPVRPIGVSSIVNGYQGDHSAGELIRHRSHPPPVVGAKHEGIGQGAAVVVDGETTHRL